MKAANIRFAHKSDVDALVELCALHAAFEEADYEPAGKKELLLSHLFGEVASAYCLVVEQSNAINGYATYMKQFSTWDAGFYIYMDCLFLTEASRGQGMGEELMDRIKAEGAKLNCSHVQWQTPDFNTRAIKFYRRIGAVSKQKERFFLDI